MNALEHAVAELEAATAALAAALGDADENAMARVLARRADALAPLRTVAPETIAPALRERLARQAELGRELLHTAVRARDALGRELGALRGARRAAATWRPPVETPRFVSRRV